MRSSAAGALTTICCPLLRSEKVDWPHDCTPTCVDDLLQDMVFHGIECLIYDRLHLLTGCPARLRDELQRIVFLRGAWEMLHVRTVEAAITLLAANHIESLVFKGTALAHSLYPNPVWRARADTDLFIAEANRAKALAVLNTLGFTTSALAANVVYYQTEVHKISVGGTTHCIDLHWRFNNSELLAMLFPYEELRLKAKPLVQLGPHAMMVGIVDALLIACVHRGAHKQVHYSAGGRAEMTADRLIWFYDFDLLARALSPMQWEEFFTKVHNKGVAAICAECLQLAVDLLHTPLPVSWQAKLAVQQVSAVDSYLAGSGLRRLWMDLQACSGLVNQAAFCWKLMFPPASYMKRKYGTRSNYWLPLLYLRRAGEGFMKRLPAVGTGQ